MRINNNKQNLTVQKISPYYQLLLGEEKYFTLSGDVLGNSRSYSFDPSSAPTNIKFKQKQKYETHLLIYLAISSRGGSSPYIHR